MKKIFFVLAAVIISTQLWSQSDTTFLDEAVITANKFPSKTSLTGKVVTIITKEDLERSGGKDLPQVLNEEAAIYISGTNSSPGKDKNLYVRGANPAHSLILMDGIPVYDPSGIGSNFDLRNISVNNIERIEIVKGSQSTLYGSDAIAGVINIITKSNTSKKLSGNAGISYGSHETIRANAGFNGKWGIVDYNAAYSFYSTAGIDEAVSNSFSSVTDNDKFRQHAFQAGIGIRPSSKIYIQPFLKFGYNNGDIDQGAFTDELDYTYSQESWQAGLKNEFGFGKAKIHLLYQYNHIDRDYLDDSTKSVNGFDSISHGVYKGSEHLLDLYTHFNISKQIKLTIGADYRRSSTYQFYYYHPAWGPIDTTDEQINQESIYAAVNFNNDKGFNLEAGGRINFHSAYGNHTVYNLNPCYLINKKIKVFANFSAGYRTPSLYQLYSEYGNKDLKPEAANSIEGGLEYILQNKFTGRVVYFNRNVKDILFFYFNPTTFVSQYINQDKQKDHGFELEMTFKPVKQLRIKTWYAYVNGEITTKKNGKDTTFFNLLRRPKSSGGINISWSATKKLYISSNLFLAGERKDSYFDNSTFMVVDVTLKSYALLDLYAEYALFNKLRVFVEMHNVTSSDFTEISGFNTQGFSAYGGIRVNF